jgi:hypothetical protein
MKPNKHTALAGSIALALLASVSLSHGQLPVSRQVVNSPVAVPLTGNATVGVPFVQSPVVRDVVSNVSGQVITGTAGGYGAYTANTHMVLIKTGAGYGKGLTISSNTATDLTVTGTIPALTNGSDEFEIVPLPTLASTFGGVTSAPIDLSGASTAAAADKVLLGGVQYFYKTTGVAAPGWKTTGGANTAGDLGSTPIPTLQAITILRGSAATATVVNVRGVAREGRAIIDIPTGTTFLSWPFPQEVSLLDSGLQGTILGASTAAGADKVIINGVQYFYKTTGVAAPGWKSTSAANAALPGANNIILNPGGRGYVIVRAGAPVSHTAPEAYTP